MKTNAFLTSQIVCFLQKKLQPIEKVTFRKLQGFSENNISLHLSGINLPDNDEIFLSPRLWTLHGLSLSVSQCDVRSIHFTVEENIGLFQGGMSLMVDIHNTSFESLNVFYPRTEISISDCYIDAKGLLGPTLVSASNGKISIKNGYFVNFTAATRPTLIKAWSGTRAILDNTTISGNYGNHGVIRLNDDCELIIKGSKIRGNKLAQGLSTLMIQNGVKVTLKDSILEDNEAFFGGTLLLLNLSSLECVNTIFRRNSAVRGGAILAQENSFVSLNNCSFFGNVAKLNPSSLEGMSSSVFGELVVSQADGGAIMMDEDSKLSIKSSIFSDNSAQSSGGAIYASWNSSINVTGTKFMTNMANNGGAIILTTKSDINIRKSNFTDNFGSTSGGAVSLLNTVVGNFSACYMKGNRAKNGGALYSYDNIELTIKNSLFKNNTAVYRGGCLSAINACTHYVVGSTFKGNIANSGGVTAISQNISLSFNRCKFTENEGYEVGGVAMVMHESSVLFAACNFSRNKARSAGVALVNCYGLINFVRSQFSNNQASDGGIAVGGIANIVVDNSHFVNNKALTKGGIFLVDASIEIGHPCRENTIQSDGKDCSRLDIKKSYFENNTAALQGGCISGYGNLRVQIDKCTFLHNNAFIGGVLNLEYDGKLNVSRSNFTGNVALASGGAINLGTNITCDCQDSFFLMNAAQTGVSICANEKVKIRISNSTLFGDMVLNSTLLPVSRAAERSNLYITGNSEVIVYDTYFLGRYRNVVALVLKYNVNCTVSNCTFARNSGYKLAGAMVMENNVTCNIESSTFYNNSGGSAGAIDMTDRVSLFVRNSTFFGNVLASDEKSDIKGRLCYLFHIRFLSRQLNATSISVHVSSTL